MTQRVLPLLFSSFALAVLTTTAALAEEERSTAYMAGKVIGAVITIFVGLWVLSKIQELIARFFR